MKKAIIRDESSLTSSRLGNRPEHPAFPPIKGEPGTANLHTLSAGAGNPSSSSKPASAPSCTCGQVVAVAEYDSQLLYRRCLIHEKDAQGTWFIDELWELDDPGLTLTPQGRAFRRELLGVMKNG